MSSHLWKISHGKSDLLPNVQHDALIQNNYVAIGYSPDERKVGKGQGPKFASIPEGDYFYLVRNRQIILLGRFSTAKPEPVPGEIRSEAGWWMRKFETIKDLSQHPYSSALVSGKDAWRPSAFTTVASVPVGHSIQFGKDILTPAFNLQLTDLDTGYSHSGDQPTPVQLPDWIGSTARNRIFYGPPGTGKTYHTLSAALSIIDNALPPQTDDEYWLQKQRFDELRREGRISFVTFHQSFSYEDFIEGIRAEVVEKQLSYLVKDGIFKQMAIAARYSQLLQASNPGSSIGDINFGDLFNNFMEWIEENPDLEIRSSTNKALSFQPTNSKDTFYISHGASTKTHSVGRERLSKLYKHYASTNVMEKLRTKEIKQLIGGANTTAYWAVLNAMVTYKETHFALLQEAHIDIDISANVDYAEKKARVREADPADFGQGQPFVLIIDEINRGNTARVFGELITLIEDTKRAGRLEQAELTLPYSNEVFTVPDNLYLIGTMNTADRSLSTIDTALRRRFDFLEMLPQVDKLNGIIIAESINLSTLLQAMNNRIEQLYDREHTIGHAFFMPLTSKSPLVDLAAVFRNKVLPLLEEYFFEDWEKISKVLGKAPIYKVKPSTNLGFEAKNKVYYRDTSVLMAASTYVQIYQ